VQARVPFRYGEHRALSLERWANYVCIFCENGLNVYEGTVGVDVEGPNDVGRVQSILDLREQSHSQFTASLK